MDLANGIAISNAKSELQTLAVKPDLGRELIDRQRTIELRLDDRERTINAFDLLLSEPTGARCRIGQRVKDTTRQLEGLQSIQATPEWSGQLAT